MGRVAVLMLLLSTVVACPSSESALETKASSVESPSEQAKPAELEKSEAHEALGPASAPQKHGDLILVAGISYVNPSCDDRMACICTGTLRYGENALRRVGVTPEVLKAGVPCLIGDYDGNEVADVAVAEPWDEGHASQVMVLMFDQAGLSAAVLLPKRVKGLGQRKEGLKYVLFEPGPTEKKAYFELRNARFEYVRP